MNILHTLLHYYYYYIIIIIITYIRYLQLKKEVLNHVCSKYP